LLVWAGLIFLLIHAHVTAMVLELANVRPVFFFLCIEWTKLRYYNWTLIVQLGLDHWGQIRPFPIFLRLFCCFQLISSGPKCLCCLRVFFFLKMLNLPSNILMLLSNLQGYIRNLMSFADLCRNHVDFLFFIEMLMQDLRNSLNCFTACRTGG